MIRACVQNIANDLVYHICHEFMHEESQTIISQIMSCIQGQTYIYMLIYSFVFRPKIIYSQEVLRSQVGLYWPHRPSYFVVTNYIVLQGDKGPQCWLVCLACIMTALPASLRGTLTCPCVQAVFLGVSQKEVITLKFRPWSNTEKLQLYQIAKDPDRYCQFQISHISGTILLVTGLFFLG